MPHQDVSQDPIAAPHRLCVMTRMTGAQTALPMLTVMTMSVAR